MNDYLEDYYEYDDYDDYTDRDTSGEYHWSFSYRYVEQEIE